jgi:DNA-binding PadR family transcriptional regulator
MLATNIALSYGAAAILHAVASGRQFGFDIMEATGLTSGTVYPALERLESRGLLKSKWEDDAAARREGRPARRYFALTGAGATALKAALDRYKALRPIPGFAGPHGPAYNT